MHSDRLGALPDAGEVALPAGKRFHLDFKSSAIYTSRKFGEAALRKRLIRSGTVSNEPDLTQPAELVVTPK